MAIIAWLCNALPVPLYSQYGTLPHGHKYGIAVSGYSTSSDNWYLPVNTAKSGFPGSASLCELQLAINRLKHGFLVPYGPIMALEPML